ncbi:MAG TPA: hypothetical protein VII27_03855, partial [Thermoplasmata archaeon]
TFLVGPGTGGTRGGGLPIILNTGTPQEITATPLSAQPTVNGACSDAEYSDVGGAKDDLNNLTLYAGMYSDYLYICTIVKWDTSNGSTGTPTDYGVIVFDRFHNGGANPQTDDRMFWVNLTSSDLWDNKGSGSAWVDCGTSCNAGDAARGAFDGTHPNYEFKIFKDDVVVSGSTTAGFGLLAFNNENSTFVRWGSLSEPVDMNKPDSWGHITVPEFTDLLVPIAIVGVIYFIGRRRRRAADP